ncbi:hypothetical protein BG011_004410 [Mortierella polycephala]|uniref:Uncharacterized protein n=1 Tax=Mortierella polycephala TaxID=41804 RepID=A0A9P6QG94_9FUNG|nr:hypothetical protein BG011_004410 [Mortierella polycephala]
MSKASIRSLVPMSILECVPLILGTVLYELEIVRFVVFDRPTRPKSPMACLEAVKFLQMTMPDIEKTWPGIIVAWICGIIWFFSEFTLDIVLILLGKDIAEKKPKVDNKTVCLQLNMEHIKAQRSNHQSGQDDHQQEDNFQEKEERKEDQLIVCDQQKQGGSAPLRLISSDITAETFHAATKTVVGKAIAGPEQIQESRMEQQHIKNFSLQPALEPTEPGVALKIAIGKENVHDDEAGLPQEFAFDFHCRATHSQDDFELSCPSSPSAMSDEYAYEPRISHSADETLEYNSLHVVRLQRTGHLHFRSIDEVDAEEALVHKTPTEHDISTNVSEVVSPSQSMARVVEQPSIQVAATESLTPESKSPRSRTVRRLMTLTQAAKEVQRALLSAHSRTLESTPVDQSQKSKKKKRKNNKSKGKKRAGSPEHASSPAAGQSTD